MAELVGSLLVSLGLDSAQFKSGLSEAEKSLKKTERNIVSMGRDVQKAGVALTATVTASFAALVASSVPAAIESREALAQVEAGLNSMGDAAGRNLKQLTDQAALLQSLSTFDDDDILKNVTANMLTFGDVADTQFDRAQMAVIDLATRLDTDLKSSTILIGKALNDPIKGLSGLSRVGIKLSADQEALAKSLAATGDIAGAQNVILNELEKQYAGSAKAARDAAPGSDTIDAWRNFQETVGDIVLNVLPPLTNVLTGVLDGFNNLSPGTQQFIIGAGAMLAVLGPVLIGLGGIVQLAAPLLAAMATVGSAASVAAGGGALGGLAAVLAGAKAGVVGLVAALGPILIPIAAVAAAGALIYANWDKIGPVLANLAARFTETLGPKLSALIATVSGALTALWDGPLGSAIRSVIDVIGSLGAIFLNIFGEVIVRAISAAIDIISGLVSHITSVVGVIASLLTGDFAGAWQGVKDIISNAINTAINVIASLTGFAPNAIKNMVADIGRSITGTLSGIWDSAIAKIEKVRGFFFNLWDQVTRNSYIPDMVSDIGRSIAQLEGNMVAPIERYTQLSKEAFLDLQNDVAGILARLFPDQALRLDYIADLAKIEAAYKRGAITAGTYENAVAALNAEYREAAFGPARVTVQETDLEGFGIDIGETIASATRDIVPIFETKVSDPLLENLERITRGFSDMVVDVEGSIKGLVSSFKSGDIVGIIVGVADTIGAIAGAISGIKSGFGTKVPAFADGTNFAPGGLSLVGERGPELVNLPRGAQVIPNNKLNSFGGGQGGGVVEVRLNSDMLDAQIISGSVRVVEAAEPNLTQAAVAETFRQSSRGTL